jgi:hypothetical protein
VRGSTTVTSLAAAAAAATESTADVNAFIAAINSADELFLLARGVQGVIAFDNNNNNSAEDSFQTIVDILKRDDVRIEKATEVCNSVSILYNMHWANYCSSVRRSIDIDAGSKAQLYAKAQQHVDKWQRRITAAPALLERLQLYSKRVDPRCIELYELNVQRLKQGVEFLSTAVKLLVSLAMIYPTYFKDTILKTTPSMRTL